jgi:hypothetical protein
MTTVFLLSLAPSIDALPPPTLHESGVVVGQVRRPASPDSGSSGGSGGSSGGSSGGGGSGSGGLIPEIPGRGVIAQAAAPTPIKKKVTSGQSGGPGKPETPGK